MSIYSIALTARNKLKIDLPARVIIVDDLWCNFEVLEDDIVNVLAPFTSVDDVVPYYNRTVCQEGKVK